MKKLSSHLKILTLSILLFVIVLIGFVATFVLIRNKNIKVSELETEISAETIRETRFKSTKTSALETGVVSQELEEFIVPNDGELGFIEEIERIGKSTVSDVKTLSVSLKDYEENERFEWLVVSLVATGSWNDVLNYTAKLETLPYRIENDQIGLEYVDPGTWRSSGLYRVLKQKEQNE